ncbi:hypothetical protein [Desulfovibrio cuneatus]|uniref:hypothetical protein n=1 Tax=Desulfovibrio cuneatus TaxID=159728 RepID=UPI0004864C93|nr:hypothetical protein [Desulfovibrio cuneatus]
MTTRTTQTTRKRSAPSEATCTAEAAKKRRRQAADAVPVQADCPQDAGSLQADAPRRRSRSERVRPESLTELQSALDAGRLDNRTREAQRLVSAREALAKTPEVVCRGLLLDCIATSSVVLGSLFEELAKPGAIMKGGELSQIVTKHLPEVQRSLRGNIDALQRLDGRQPATKEDTDNPLDVSSILLAAAQEGRGGGPGAAGGDSAPYPHADNDTNF